VVHTRVLLRNVEYPLLTFYLTAKIDKEIWVHYNEERDSFSRTILEKMKITDVIGLKRVIKARFDISENVTIRSGGDNLEDSELIAGLYNTEDNALEVTVEGNGMYKIVVSKF
jgi:hypothetical protein